MKKTSVAKKAPSKSTKNLAAGAKKPAAAKKAGARKPVAAKKASAKSAPVAKTASAKSAPSAAMARRADYGAPIDGFFAKHTGAVREVLDTLRGLVEEAVPNATSSLKWGMPFFSLDGEMVCAIAGFKAHVNLILPGAPGTFADPQGLLEGEGKTGQHLKVRTLSELPRAAVRGWLKTAAKNAKQAANA